MAKKKGTKAPAKKKSMPAKRSAPAKAVAKKASTKKTPAKKAAAKKPAVKKALIKKSSNNKKAVAKKTVGKTPAPKKTVTKKQAVPVKTKPKAPPVKAISSAPVIKQPESTVKNTGNNDIVNATSNAAGHELNVSPTEDPLRTFDKHEFQKATAKGDPRSKLHLNSNSKSKIRPSGKKPLW